MIKVESNLGGIETGSEIDESNDADSIEKSELHNEADDEKKEIQPEDEKIEVDIREEVKGDLLDFYKFIRKNEYIFNPNKCTVAKIESESTQKLAPIIREFRHKLKEGGSAKPDVIIQEIIDIALDHLKIKKSRWEFLDQITDPSKITSPQIIKFNKFIAQSLESGKK